MHSISFRVCPGFLEKTRYRNAFFASWGRVPRFSDVELSQNILTIFSDLGGTGTVHVPVLHETLGLLLFSTETLLQRDKPYLLVKELARGELGRLLRHVHEWKSYGLDVPQQAQRELENHFHRFGRIATGDENAKTVETDAESILFSLHCLSTTITRHYVAQTLRSRQSHQERMPVSLGVFANIGGGIQPFLEREPVRGVFQNTFQTVATTPTWREVQPRCGEYCWELVENRLEFIERLGMRNLIGPIVSFDPTTFPLWVRNLVDLDEAFERAATSYVRAFAERFSQRSRLWVLSNNVFSAPECGFSIGRAVSLICALAAELKRFLPSEVVIVGIDQPWGDYYRKTDTLLPFAAIAESFAGLDAIDGLLLELNLGLEKNHTLPRDPNLLGRLIDAWSLTEKQMFVSLSVPSRKSIDPSLRTSFSENPFPWSERFQSEWATRMLLTSLTKRNVHGFFWNQLIDPNLCDPDRLPGHIGRLPGFSSTGLISEHGEMKPAFYDLAAIREKYLL